MSLLYNMDFIHPCCLGYLKDILMVCIVGSKYLKLLVSWEYLVCEVCVHLVVWMVAYYGWRGFFLFFTIYFIFLLIFYKIDIIVSICVTGIWFRNVYIFWTFAKFVIFCGNLLRSLLQYYLFYLVYVIRSGFFEKLFGF